MDWSRRALADQTFARTAGAALVPGNAVRILTDGKENYPAWLDAIAAAASTIHFESYVIHGDEIGLEIAEALAARARQGVRVRVLCDWFGSLSFDTRRIWPIMRAAGVEARTFNPPRFDSPFGWISRDHRKVITIDARTAFVSGLCVGRDWVGDPARQVEPWRDTGVAIEGPAVADIDFAFAVTWAMAGANIPAGELRDRESIALAGDVSVRVVASTPATGELYRLDQLIAAGARPLPLVDRRVFRQHDSVRAGPEVGGPGRCGCSTPGAGRRRCAFRPITLPRRISAAARSRRPRVRVERNDAARKDGRRRLALGTSRFDEPQSYELDLGNWELDVAVHDEPFAAAMEQMYLEDLSHATEVVLTARRGVRLSGHPERRPPPRLGVRHSSGRRAAAGALGIGGAIGAAITGHRVLGPAEARVMASAGVVLLIVTAVIAQWPKVLAIPVGVMLGWVALSLLVRAARLSMRHGRKDHDENQDQNIPRQAHGKGHPQ